jgi:phage anti-repressor protein
MINQFDLTIARSLIESNEQFPVDFDTAWEWLGYTRKDSALKTLKNNFKEGMEFSSSKRKTPQGGRPSDLILLTVNCFKSLAMMAGTEQGKQVRLYFLECERQLKEQQSIKMPTTMLEAAKFVQDMANKWIQAEEDKLKLQQCLDIADSTIEGYRNLFKGESTLSMKQAADALAIPKLGRNNLIKFLREQKMIVSSSNSPSRYAIERGYLVALTYDWSGNDGNKYTNQSSEITWKGFCWLVKELKKEGYTVRVTPQAMWDNHKTQLTLIK